MWQEAFTRHITTFAVSWIFSIDHSREHPFHTEQKTSPFSMIGEKADRQGVRCLQECDLINKGVTK